ncbi:hypothetical protein TNCV_4878851 [Trichonephila clavipes]|nr:hypothetical protein TNCV_4878851 [Trichonephila clavipes]
MILYSIFADLTNKHYRYNEVSDLNLWDFGEPVIYPYFQSLTAVSFQQENGRPHVVSNVQDFLSYQITLLPWPACSPDLLPIGHI